jgi:hypothetical protein
MGWGIYEALNWSKVCRDEEATGIEGERGRVGIKAGPRAEGATKLEPTPEPEEMGGGGGGAKMGNGGTGAGKVEEDATDGKDGFAICLLLDKIGNGGRFLMPATIWGGKWLKDCPLNVTGAEIEAGGGGKGGKILESVVEAAGILRSSGDPISRWTRSWYRMACWWSWGDKGGEAKGGGGDGGGGGGGDGGGMTGIRNVAPIKGEGGGIKEGMNEQD